MDQRLVKACEGKSESQGGLNLEEARQHLIRLFPQYEAKLRSIKRSDLKGFCQSVPKIRDRIKYEKERYFVPGAPLSDKEKKWCRCVAHVSANPSSYNPYAVCAKSVGTTASSCSPWYDYSSMPRQEVEALAKLKGKTVEELIETSLRERQNKGFSSETPLPTMFGATAFSGIENQFTPRRTSSMSPAAFPNLSPVSDVLPRDQMELSNSTPRNSSSEVKMMSQQPSRNSYNGYSSSYNNQARLMSQQPPQGSNGGRRVGELEVYGTPVRVGSFSPRSTMSQNSRAASPQRMNRTSFSSRGMSPQRMNQTSFSQRNSPVTAGSFSPQGSMSPVTVGSFSPQRNSPVTAGSFSPQGSMSPVTVGSFSPQNSMSQNSRAASPRRMSPQGSMSPVTVGSFSGRSSSSNMNQGILSPRMSSRMSSQMSSNNDVQVPPGYIASRYPSMY